MLKISIIIVNYNSKNNLLKLLNSIEKYKIKITNEILIINNDKNNLKIKSKLPIKIFDNKKNLGFAKAVNKGIQLSTNDYVLMLNPDCYFFNNSINNISKYITKNTGILGGKIINPINNKISYSINNYPNLLTPLFEFSILKKIFPNNIYTTDFWPQKNKFIEKPKKVASVCGAFLLLNKKIGLLNEKYFMYFEDIEIGIKANRLGYDVKYIPNIQIAHLGGGSTKTKHKTALKHWYKSREIFIDYYYSGLKKYIIQLLLKIEYKIVKTYTLLRYGQFK